MLKLFSLNKTIRKQDIFAVLQQIFSLKKREKIKQKLNFAQNYGIIGIGISVLYILFQF